MCSSGSSHEEDDDDDEDATLLRIDKSPPTRVQREEKGREGIPVAVHRKERRKVASAASNKALYWKQQQQSRRQYSEDSIDICHEFSNCISLGALREYAKATTEGTKDYNTEQIRF